MPSTKRSKQSIVPMPGVLPDDILSQIIAIAFAVTLPDNAARYRWSRKGLKLKCLCGMRLMCKAFAVGLKETMYKCAFLRYTLVRARVARNEASWRVCCINHNGEVNYGERDRCWEKYKKGDDVYMADAQRALAEIEHNALNDEQTRLAAMHLLTKQAKDKLHAKINSKMTQCWIYRRSQWNELARIGRPMEPIYDTDDELWHSYYDMNS